LAVSLLAVLTASGEILLRPREALGGHLFVLVGYRRFDVFSGYRQVGGGRLLFLQLCDFAILTADVEFNCCDFALFCPEQRIPALGFSLGLVFGHRLQQEFEIVECELRVLGGDRLSFLGGGFQLRSGCGRRGAVVGVGG